MIRAFFATVLEFLRWLAMDDPESHCYSQKYYHPCNGPGRCACPDCPEDA
jgi:hypothetical protein